MPRTLLLTLGAAWIAVAMAWPGALAATTGEPLPLYGGDVRSVVFDPGDPARAFAGTASGQLFRSDDAGEHWRPAGTEVAFPGWVVGTLLFDPESPSRLWAGLWGPWGGGGVAVSDDLGASWSWRAGGGLEREPVYALAIAPGAERALFAGTRGGVWRSRDDGATWSRVSDGVAGLEQVSSLAVDPADPRRLLAGTWRRAFRSEDGGASWHGVFEGMVLDTEVFHLLPAAGEPGRLWASTCGWIYRGDGFGERWERVREGLTERRTPALDLLPGGRLLAGTVGGVFLSDDEGASFRPAVAPAFAVHALAHAPERPQRVLAATEGGGVWRSDDAGESFVPSSSGLAASRVVAVERDGGVLWVALAWAGPLSPLQRSDDGGATFVPVPPPPAAVLDLAVVDGRIYAATEHGLWTRHGEEWIEIPGPEPASPRILTVEPRAGAVEATTALARYRLEAGRLREVARGDVLARRRAGVPTGDPSLPRLEQESGRLVLRDPQGRTGVELDASLPPGSILSAALVGDRLLVGTSGFGLRALPLPPPPAARPDQSRASESRIRR